ncbi:MAG: BatD family protein [Permianibacter sp.]
MVRPFFYIIAALAALLMTPAWAELSVSLDRNPVRVNETFTLEVKTDDSDADEPDIVWPDGIQQLRRNSINSRSIVNGKVSAERSWRYSLVARQTGDYTIPAIQVGKDRSAPLTVSVLAADSKAVTSNQPVLLKASVDQRSVYAQQQLILTVQLLRNVPMRFAQLSEPNLPTALVQKLGDDSEYETAINGVGYLVIERRYAIFPQQAGELVIDPIRFQGDINQDRQLSLFGSFSETQPVSLETQPITITVKAPARADNWLPAQQLDLADAISSEPYRVGEPLTWTITVVADGVLPAQLPALQPDAGSDWKIYPDQAQDKSQWIASGVRTTRTQKFALVPLRAGRVQLPALQLEWWRLSDQTSQRASLPLLEIDVAAAAGNAIAPASAPRQTAPTTPAISANQSLAQPPTAETALAHSPNAATISAGYASYWPALTALFALLWLTTLGLWWRARRAGTRLNTAETAAGSQHNTATSSEATLRAVRDACQRHDAKAARQRMLQWAGADSLDTLAAIQEPAVANVLRDLQQALYGPPPQRWRGDELAAVLPRLRPLQPASSTGNKASALPPLYPAH